MTDISETPLNRERAVRLLQTLNVQATHENVDTVEKVLTDVQICERRAAKRLFKVRN